MQIGPGASKPSPAWERAWEVLFDFLASNEALVLLAASVVLWLWVVRRIVNRGI